MKTTAFKTVVYALGIAAMTSGAALAQNYAPAPASSPLTSGVIYQQGQNQVMVPTQQAEAPMMMQQPPACGSTYSSCAPSGNHSNTFGMEPTTPLFN